MERSIFLKALLVPGLMLSLSPLTVSAQPIRAARWVYLGQANVDGRADHDKIKVGESHGPMRRIQIVVQIAAVDFDRVVVHYGNGADLPVSIAAKIPAGGKTREIDLPGDKRWIDSVEVWYRKGPFTGGKPKIRLMGIKY